jgi:hypothetical protein
MKSLVAAGLVAGAAAVPLMLVHIVGIDQVRAMLWRRQRRTYHAFTACFVVLNVALTMNLRFLVGAALFGAL